MGTVLRVAEGDITTFAVDAIVNAANATLLGGGGVDGAIHRAAGPRLLTECRTLGGCATSAAKITAGYDLPARFVIHTVGPVWQGGTHGEDDDLERCYRSVLVLAHANQLRALAFPSISTGVYRFPLGRAAAIATATLRSEALNCPALAEVTFVCFSAAVADTYRRLLRDSV